VAGRGDRRRYQEGIAPRPRNRTVRRAKTSPVRAPAFARSGWSRSPRR
jgi:hypothetical protein